MNNFMADHSFYYYSLRQKNYIDFFWLWLNFSTLDFAFRILLTLIYLWTPFAETNSVKSIFDRVMNKGGKKPVKYARKYVCRSERKQNAFEMLPLYVPKHESETMYALTRRSYNILPWGVRYLINK